MASIEHARLRAVVAHWDAARAGKLMPAWGDLDPAVLARNLEIVWSWKYDRAADRFTGRLSGEEINAAFGKSLRGADMAEFFKDFDYPAIFARHKRVVTDPCCAHGTGQVFAHAHRVGLGERVIMPLAEHGANADGIFGATIYTPGPRQWDPDAKPILGEQVTFYPLS